MRGHTKLSVILPPFFLYCCCIKINCHPFRQTWRYSYGTNSLFVRVHVILVSGHYFFIFCLLSFSYNARVPLTSGYRTTGGTRTKI
jgi:hypothetical protein